MKCIRCFDSIPWGKLLTEPLNASGLSEAFQKESLWIINFKKWLVETEIISTRKAIFVYASNGRQKASKMQREFSKNISAKMETEIISTRIAIWCEAPLLGVEQRKSRVGPESVSEITFFVIFTSLMFEPAYKEGIFEFFIKNHAEWCRRFFEIQISSHGLLDAISRKCLGCFWTHSKTPLLYSGSVSDDYKLFWN